MPQTVRPFPARRPQDDLTRVRRHAALARALLDELDRALPAAAGSARSDAAFAIHEQLAEELGRVGCRLLECAASLSDVAIPGASRHEGSLSG